jgi:hypothetical protein
MAYGGFYRSKVSADEASRDALYAYTKKTFGWDEFDTEENNNSPMEQGNKPNLDILKYVLNPTHLY